MTLIKHCSEAGGLQLIRHLKDYTLLANLFSYKLLHLTAVGAADDELGARSQVFDLVAHLDRLTAEVALHWTIGTVVGQMLI